MDTYAPRLLLAKDRTTQPWANGGGSATLVAIHPETATVSDFDWRVSIASVEKDGDFSDHPDVQRHLMPLSTTGLTLIVNGQTHRLPGFESFEFSGDSAVQATNVSSASLDLNLMVRRDKAVGSLTTQPVTRGLNIAAAPNEFVVLVLLDAAFGLAYLDAVELQPDSNINLDGAGLVAIARIMAV